MFENFPADSKNLAGNLPVAQYMYTRSALGGALWVSLKFQKKNSILFPSNLLVAHISACATGKLGEGTPSRPIITRSALNRWCAAGKSYTRSAWAQVRYG
jgi:hypothetical protein